jgi:hypothetical protein
MNRIVHQLPEKRRRSCPASHGKSNPHLWAAANQPDGQITSDFQKPMSSPFCKNISVFA